MSINGLFDTAIRRFPCAILFWSSIGYFWKHHFSDFAPLTNPRIKKAATITMWSIHCILLFFFIRIIAGDFYYFRAFTMGNRTKNGPSIKHIERSLSICPFHPDALYRAGLMGIVVRKFDYANSIAEKLEQTAPHYRPTNLIKGYSAFEQQQYSAALQYADREIKKNPNLHKAYTLKLRALKNMNLCDEMVHLRDSIVNASHRYARHTHWKDTLSATSIKRSYLRYPNKVRKLIGGKKLENAYFRYALLKINNTKKNMQRSAEYSKLSCSPKERK
jgi:tetratricopeptide (TPR) repeat protein